MAYAYAQDKLVIGGEWVDPLDGEGLPSSGPSVGIAMPAVGCGLVS